MEAMGLIGHMRMRLVSLRFVQGAAMIMVQEPSAGIAALREALDECRMNTDSVSLIFLWFMGGELEQRKASANMEVLCNMLEAEISLLPQPVVGLADGCVCYTGTRLLSVCDFAIATREASFEMGGRYWASTLDAVSAWEVGLVCHIVSNVLALTIESEAMRNTFANCTLKVLKDLKQRLRASRTQVFDIAEPMYNPEPTPMMVHLPDFCAQPYLGTAAPKIDHGQDLYIRGFEKQEGQPAYAEEPSMPAKRRVSKKKSGGLSKESKEQLPDGWPVTTIMIRHIPCSVTHEQLADLVKELGFARKYDLLHLPTAGRSHKSGSSNLGYGFINFSNAEDAAAFAQAVEGYKFEGTSSTKSCTASPAHVQGFASTLENLQRTKRCARGSFICTL